jgi:hypothetical protein
LGLRGRSSNGNRGQRCAGTKSNLNSLHENPQKTGGTSIARRICNG